MTGSGARPDPGSGDDATHDGPPAVRPVAGGRHEARERAVHLLYEAGIKGLTVDEVLAAQVLAPDPYTTDLVRGVAAHHEELDELIAGLAKGWTLERMPQLDLVVMRVGCFELAHRPDVPRAAVLSEAVSRVPVRDRQLPAVRERRAVRRGRPVAPRRAAPRLGFWLPGARNGQVRARLRRGPAS